MMGMQERVEKDLPKKKKLSLKTVRMVAVSLVIFVLGMGSGFWFKGSEYVSKALVVNRDSGPEEIDFSLFWEVWDKLHNEYLDSEKLDDKQMVYGAIKGMTAAIGDPYTVFLPPTDNKRAKEDLNGAFEGVGIQLGFVEKQLAVMSPLEKHPAIAAGVRAGDLILHIKDEQAGTDVDTIGMNLPEAVELIRGKKGTTVTLTVLHDGGEEPVEITIVRDTIVVPSVEVEIGRVEDGLWQEREDGEVAWLRVYRFGERTESQWGDAIRKIQLRQGGQGFLGIVLDVRNNPGGFLNGSVFLASEFIAEGVVVEQQGKFSSQAFEVERRGRLVGVPMVVLVNKGSASASEILAGALRDQLKLKLIGEKTFGKGTVQDAEELGNGAGIHITTGRWVLPSGDWIHDSGLTPDIEVEFEVDEASESAELEGRKDSQLKRAVEELIK